MRFGESYGEACRYCGSTHIVVWPPSSSGNCAVCSDQVHAWEARLDQLDARREAVAHAALLAAEAERRAAERAERRAARHAALMQAGRTLMKRSAALGRNGTQQLRVACLREAQRARRLMLRALPARSRTAH